MSFIDQINESESRRQSEYFSAGNYLVRINDFKEGQNRMNREFVVLETTVLDSDDLNQHPKGCERSWLLMKDQETTPRNVRAMLCGVLGVSDSGLDKKMISKALTPDKKTGLSALSGLKTVINAKDIETRRGTMFTLLNFATSNQDATTLEEAIQ